MRNGELWDSQQGFSCLLAPELFNGYLRHYPLSLNNPSKLLSKRKGVKRAGTNEPIMVPDDQLQHEGGSTLDGTATYFRVQSMKTTLAFTQNQGQSLTPEPA